METKVGIFAYKGLLSRNADFLIGLSGPLFHSKKDEKKQTTGKL